MRGPHGDVYGRTTKHLATFCPLASDKRSRNGREHVSVLAPLGQVHRKPRSAVTAAADLPCREAEERELNSCFLPAGYQDMKRLLRRYLKGWIVQQLPGLPQSSSASGLRPRGRQGGRMHSQAFSGQRCQREQNTNAKKGGTTVANSIVRIVACSCASHIVLRLFSK